MTKPKAKKPRRKPSREEAIGMLSSVQKRRRAKEAEYLELERQFHTVRDQHVDAMVMALRLAGGQLREKLGEVERLASGAEKLEAIVAANDQAQAVGTIKVDDPMMTQAEIVEQRKKWPDAHDIGKLKAKVNMVTLLGGFARFDKRTSDQEAAATAFLSLYQRSQLRSDQAFDYAAPRVDTSLKGDSDSVLMTTEEARKKLAEVKKLLGDETNDLLIKVVGGCASVRSIAGDDASNRQVGKLADQVRGALDRLAIFWRLAGIPTEEKRKITGWDDGSPAVYVGSVVNQKHPSVSR